MYCSYLPIRYCEPIFICSDFILRITGIQWFTAAYFCNQETKRKIAYQRHYGLIHGKKYLQGQGSHEPCKNFLDMSTSWFAVIINDWLIGKSEHQLDNVNSFFYASS